MSETTAINIDSLDTADVNSTNAIYYNMLVQRQFGNSQVSFRTRLSSVADIYMPANLLDDCLNSVKSIQPSFEKLLNSPDQKIAEKDFCEENNIISKLDAEMYRSRLITPEVLSGLVGNYLKKTQLDIDIAATNEHGMALVNSLANGLVTGAAIIRNSEKNMNSLEMITDAIDSIEISGGDEE